MLKEEDFRTEFGKRIFRERFSRFFPEEKLEQINIKYVEIKIDKPHQNNKIGRAHV